MKMYVFRLLLLAAVLAFCVACASARQPFAAPEDAALKQTLTEALGSYYIRTMHITVSGGRVYMEGELRNRQELADAMAIIRGTEGVTAIVEDVFLVDIGRNNWDPGFR